MRRLRDVYGNSIAIITFTEPARKLSLFSEIDVDLYDDAPIDCVIDPIAQSYPFQYAADEQVEIDPLPAAQLSARRPGGARMASGPLQARPAHQHLRAPQQAEHPHLRIVPVRRPL